MDYNGEFDFFYGKESERYHFITIPKLLLTEERFRSMSVEAKLLYGCLLDRNSLSQKNGWMDEQNRVYVIYTIENMKQDLGCASEKVNKVVFCKHFLHKVAKSFCRSLHLHFVGDCKAACQAVRPDRK